MPRRADFSQFALITALCLSVSACGGGGNNAPAPIATPPAPTPPTENPAPDPNIVASFKTSEFNLSWGLDAINAAEAYALGYTGENALIAVIDFNFNHASNELNLHPGSVGPVPKNVAIYEAQIGEPATDTPHGHAVATTAAGLKNDNGIHGVAFDASVLAVDFFSGVNSRQEVFDGVLYTISDPWTYAFNRGARIFNKSFGYDEDDIIENPPIVSLGYTIEYDTTAVALGGLVISSAGNNSDLEPSLSNLDAIARLSQQGLLNSGPGAYIIAGSVNEDLTLSNFSDQAGSGESRFHYLVAPGGQVAFPWTDGIVIGNGTSFAAPYISGAAAVVLSRWPSLTGRELADILFETATDLGAPGIDEVYGNGLLNLEAALQPIGQAKLAVSAAPPQAVSAAAVQLAPAFGDAKGLSQALSQTMILDDYGRDFFVNASKLITSPEGRTNIEARLNARRNWQSASLGLATAGQLNYSLNRDTRSTPAFALAGQAEQDFIPTIDAVFEFAGQIDNKKWYVGTGRSLSSALAREPYAEAVADNFSLTGANDTSLPTGSGVYIAVNNPVSTNTDLWFGVSRSQNHGQPLHPLKTMQQTSSVTSFAMRLDHYIGNQRLSTEIGASIEESSLFGGQSTGALQFGNGATTSWLTISGGRKLSQTITFESRATLAVTDPSSRNVQSLISDIGLITSSAFQIKASMANAIIKDDSFTLMVHQPLRVENASALLTSGQSLNADTGAVIFSNQRISLAPSGREIAIEAAYRASIIGWQVEANAAIRHDAGHFSGQQDTLFSFNISRYF